MSARCLICGNEITADTSTEYHSACAKSLFDSSAAPSFAYSTEELNRLARNIIEARISVPGVQPKLSVHLEHAPQGGGRLTLVGLDGDYILKLPTRQYAELPEAEHFAMTLARLCGIETATFGLVRLANGNLAYLTRRMDRTDGIKHMEDMCQLCERRAERKYYGSYEQIARQIWAHSAFPGEDAVRFFGLVLFSFVTGNSDMHLKNFSLIREHNGEWHLSPAYDLVPVKTVLPTDEDDLALTLNGKNRKLREKDFRTAATTMRLTEVQYTRTLRRVLRPLAANLDAALGRSFLSDEFRSRVRASIRERLALFS